jgi:hypothetical protein
LATPSITAFRIRHVPSSSVVVAVAVVAAVAVVVVVGLLLFVNYICPALDDGL